MSIDWGGNVLDMFEKLSIGKAVIRKSMRGTDFAVYPDAVGGEQRRCILPLNWFHSPSRSPEKLMTKTPTGWDYLVTRAQLAAEVSTTIQQMERIGGGQGSVGEIRVETLQRLLTAEEWREAEDVVRSVAKQQAPT